jgi:predicted membrane protein
MQSASYGDRGPGSLVRLVGGLAAVAVGCLFLADNLGFLEAERYLRFWPLAFVAVGVALLARARNFRQRLWGGVWIVVGGWLVLDAFDFTRYPFTSFLGLLAQSFWPLVLVVVGGILLWRAVRPRPRTPAVARDAESTVSAFAMFSGVKQASRSTEFTGGDLAAIMGGCEIDLRQARIADEQALVDVTAIMGGIELRIPTDWQVVGRVMPFMGAFEDKTTPPPAGTGKRLVVRGLACMGAVEVKN